MTLMATDSARIDVIPSPIGDLLLVHEEGAITALYTSEHRALEHSASAPRERHAAARAQLAAWFAGERTGSALTPAPRGTPFQREVWDELRRIPFGETRTYGELARALGRPRASRAVGAANGANPLSILVPCHRVVGADGALTGYAGGLGTKRALLEHERAVLATRPVRQPRDGVSR